MPYEPVIGLEVHAQLLTRTKAFCACSTAFGARPNTHVCPVCLGLPGALPVLGRSVKELALRAALALSCTPRSTSRFARKNYFYPDLPKGYQISQFDEPIAEHGHLDVDLDGRTLRPGITRVHIEEDAGKSVHHGGVSVVDLNRAGVPLVEIVGEPDLRSPAEASAYLRALRDVLMFVGVCDGNLEQGNFRCDANVSLRPVGETRLGTRVELKNINSFRFVERAIAHEIGRQTALLESGGTVVQETRGWNEETGLSSRLRSKELAHDYRYFPDPDLPPLVLDEVAVMEARAALPELPRAKRERFTTEMGLPAAAAQVLTSHPRIAAFFEEIATLTGRPDRAASFVASEVLRDVETRGIDASIPVSPAQVAGLLRLVDAGTISGKQAKDVYAALRGTTQTAEQVVDARGLRQESDSAVLEEVCRRVIAQNPRQADQMRAGKRGLLGFFVGLVMKETGGSANPRLVTETLGRLLGP